MKHFLTILLLWLAMSLSAQGTIEAEKVTADSLIGDGSRITGLGNQNLAVSVSGDTLHITEGNYVIIPGISASNSGNVFANAGPDISNACETSFNLQASPLQPGTTGEWSIVSGTGGVIINEMLPQALFAGQEGESYLLQWTVQMGGGASSFDQLNISIATNTQTSVADAGSDLFAIMNQSVILNGNVPDDEARWEILDGTGGILSDLNDPNATFTGVPGESYTLRWIHFNDCSTSTDQLTLTFSESAAGVPSTNGRYFIPDVSFRQYLQVLYPSVMDNDSLIIAEADIVDKLEFDNIDVQNLDGIQYLNNVRKLVLLDNYGISSIPSFPDSLHTFECFCTQLEIISVYPSKLDTLIGSSWKVTSIPEFPSDMRFIDLEILGGDINGDGEIDIPSIDFPEFPDSLRYLRLANISLLDGIGTIPPICEIVRLSDLNNECCPGEQIGQFNIPDNSTIFQISSTQLDSFPIFPQISSNLIELHLNATNLNHMPSLTNFTSLIEINLAGNNLYRLESLPTNLQFINIVSNPLLCVKNKPSGVVDQLSGFPICPE